MQLHAAGTEARNVNCQQHVKLHGGLSGEGAQEDDGCEALTELAESFKAVSACSQDAIVMIDHRGNVTLWNHAAEKMFGYSRAEVLGRNLHRLTAPPDACAAAGEKMAAFAGTGCGLVVDRITEQMAVRKDGTTFPIALSVTGVKLHGRWTAVGIARDLTGEKVLRAELLHAQKMDALGRLAGGIAHDFNNLTQAIQGNAELLLLGKQAHDGGVEEVRAILRAADRCRELTLQLLTFGRQAPAAPQLVDLNEQVTQVHRLLARTIPPMVTIEMELAEDLGSICADACQVQQLVMNLVLNARDAMPGGGTLRIQTSNVVLDEAYCRSHHGIVPGRYLRLSISDTGTGMTEDTIRHAFEPFFSTKEVGKGTGLGLSIVYGIVKAHAGSIDCSSHPGAGTRFNVLLPASDGDAEPPECGPTQDRPAVGTGETILIVDDEPAVLAFCRQALIRSGFNVLTASDGETALEVYAAQKARIAVVVLDLLMPGMGGLRCLEALRRLDPAVRVIVVSGYVPAAATADAIARMAKAMLTKPYKIHELSAAIRGILAAGAGAQTSPTCASEADAWNPKG